MKRISVWVLATLGGIVLLFSYRTSTGADATLVVPSGSSNAAAGSSDTGGSSPSTGGSGGAAGSGDPGEDASGLADGSYSGDAVSTRFGPVQVQLTVAGGVITDVQVPSYPNSNRRDTQINARAIPLLVSETIDAQSASIDMVSGATFTSRGYLQSLQSALDQAQR